MAICFNPTNNSILSWTPVKFIHRLQREEIEHRLPGFPNPSALLYRTLSVLRQCETSSVLNKLLLVGLIIAGPGHAAGICDLMRPDGEPRHEFEVLLGY